MWNQVLNKEKSKIGVTVTLKSKAGKEAELARLLSNAADIVKQTEPRTLFWYSAQVDANTFVISDGFADESALQDHFNGQVAAALKSQAENLIVGGWENGVLPNIVRTQILSIVN